MDIFLTALALFNLFILPPVLLLQFTLMVTDLLERKN